MTYRICKIFEIESGHMLSKHPDRCRFPHGHSRRIEVVVSAQALDEHEMVCDFKTLKLALGEFLDQFDHAMAVNSEDPAAAMLRNLSERVVVFEKQDPTTEVLAKHIFDYLAAETQARREYRSGQGDVYRFPPGLKLERVRVWETSTSWAEYGG